MSQILNIVGIPIGNFADITIRALQTLRSSDIIICESTKEASRLLKFFDIKKELILLNEHNENKITDEILEEIQNGKIVSIISDCGIPILEDPGSVLLKKCRENKIKLEFITGVYSVITALTLSGFDISRFYHYGFLSPKKEIRINQLKKFQSLEKPVVLMDAPYRAFSLLYDIRDILPYRKIFMGINLTTENEKLLWGNPSEILEQLNKSYSVKFKEEFIIIIDKNDKNN